MKEQIASLLVAGVSRKQVAAATGVSEGYISQLVNTDEEFQRITANTPKGDAEHDSKIDALERDALAKMQGLLQYETNLMRAAKVFQIANNAVRRSQGVSSNESGPVVSITLPAAMAVGIKVTTDKQVVEIAGRSMATMSSQQVQEKLKEKKATQLLEDATPVIAPRVAKELAKF